MLRTVLAKCHVSLNENTKWINTVVVVVHVRLSHTHTHTLSSLHSHCTCAFIYQQVLYSHIHPHTLVPWSTHSFDSWVEWWPLTFCSLRPIILERLDLFSQPKIKRDTNTCIHTGWWRPSQLSVQQTWESDQFLYTIHTLIMDGKVQRQGWHSKLQAIARCSLYVAIIFLISAIAFPGFSPWKKNTNVDRLVIGVSQWYNRTSSLRESRQIKE